MKTIVAGIRRLLPHLRISATGGGGCESSILGPKSNGRISGSLVSFAWWITGKGGKTSYPLTIIRFSCQGFFLIKSLGLTKQSCNYILQFLGVRRLSRVLVDCRIEWCGCWEYSLLTIVMDRYDGQSNIIATNIGKIWQPVSDSGLTLQVYNLPWRWELLTTLNPEPINRPIF